LLKPVRDLVIVATVRNEDVRCRLEPGRLVQATGGYRYHVIACLLPEEARAAVTAKAAADGGRGLIPPQTTLSGEDEI
jgi:hypothetical protein